MNIDPLVTLQALHQVWADALDGKPWPDSIKAPKTRELYERTLALRPQLAQRRFPMGAELEELLTLCECCYYNHLRAQSLLEEGRPGFDDKFVADCKAAIANGGPEHG